MQRRDVMVKNLSLRKTIDLTAEVNVNKKTGDAKQVIEKHIWLENKLYKLFESDRNILLTSWLTDELISAA